MTTDDDGQRAVEGSTVDPRDVHVEFRTQALRREADVHRLCRETAAAPSRGHERTLRPRLARIAALILVVVGVRHPEHASTSGSG